MVRLLLVLLVCAAGAVYLLGAGVLGYLFGPAARGWLRERPRAFGGPARRGLTVAALVAGWPLVAAALGWLRWRERRRCPFGECAWWGWRTPGSARVQALVSVYRCPHQRACTDRAVGRASWCAWCSIVPAALMASTLGALASVPVPGPGFLIVYAAVTLSTVFPLDVLAEEVLQRCVATVGPPWLTRTVED